MSYLPPFREVTIVYLSVHLLGRIEPDSVWKKKEPQINLCGPIHMALLTQPNLIKEIYSSLKVAKHFTAKYSH